MDEDPADTFDYSPYITREEVTEGFGHTILAEYIDYNPLDGVPGVAADFIAAVDGNRVRIFVGWLHEGIDHPRYSLHLTEVIPAGTDNVSEAARYLLMDFVCRWHNRGKAS